MRTFQAVGAVCVVVMFSACATMQESVDHWDDMTRQAGRLPVPAGFELRDEFRENAATIFQWRPQYERVYASLLSNEDSCQAILESEAVQMVDSPEMILSENLCGFSGTIAPSLFRRWILGIRSYSYFMAYSNAAGREQMSIVVGIEGSDCGAGEPLR